MTFFLFVLPHTIISIAESSEVFKQIKKIQEYATDNEMKMNLRKTIFLMFNTGKSIDFMPSLNIEDHNIDLVEDMTILGVIIIPNLNLAEIQNIL